MTARGVGESRSATMVSPYPCPCCGYFVFAGPPGSYEICPICDWEDDALQLEFGTTLSGGANEPTLLEAQRAYAMQRAHLAQRPGAASRPNESDRRDPSWRPIDLQLDRFSTWGSSMPARPVAHDETLYYWRETFWRRTATP